MKELVVGRLVSVRPKTSQAFAWIKRDSDKRYIGGAFCTGGYFEIDLEIVN